MAASVAGDEDIDSTFVGVVEHTGDLRESGRAAHDAHRTTLPASWRDPRLIDDETVAKLGHPDLCARGTSRICLGGGVFFEEGVDLGVLGFGEAEGGRGEGAFDLFGAAAADDGCGDGRVVKGPGNGDDAGSYVVTGADFF